MSRERGVIYKVPDPSKHWGFIQWKGQNVFVHQADVLEDEIGRHLLTLGSEVAFDLSPSIDGKSPKALRVEHLFYDAFDPAHREVSLLTYWSHNIGFLERESADRIALFPEHIERFDEIQSQIVPNLWVSHGVAQKVDKPSQWYATSAVIHTDEGVQVIDQTEEKTTQQTQQPAYTPDSFESLFESALELPLAAISMPRKAGEIYTPQEKRTTLRALIQQKKQSAA